MSKTRFNIAFSEDLEAQLEEAAAASATTKSELIRKALGLFLAAKNAERKQGLKVGFYDPETKKIETEVVNL